jgi:hypothetical protein
MPSRLHLTPIVLIVGGVWLGLLVLDGVAVEIGWLRHLTTVVPVLLVLLGLFDKWLWKMPWLNPWFATRPVLCGTWKVTIENNWKDQKGKKKAIPIVAYMSVRQTYFSLSMRLMTAESASQLIADSIARSQDGLFQVAGVYINTPSIALRGKSSEIHYGSFLLNVQGQPPTSLEGHYWTDRETRGRMTLTDRVDRVLSSFDEANKAFGKRTSLRSTPEERT